jgi:adenylylsulfate kinase
MIIWLTGLSGAGKSTLAEGLARMLRARGIMPLMIDGDALREELSRELGFSDEDRRENIRRAGAVACMAARSGLVSICSLISPIRAERDSVRSQCERAGSLFLEVHVSTPLSLCEARDPKGLYRKARAGLIPRFTGIDSVYEPPEKPELILETGSLSVEEASDLLYKAVLQRLTPRGGSMPSDLAVEDPRK